MRNSSRRSGSSSGSASPSPRLCPLRSARTRRTLRIPQRVRHHGIDPTYGRFILYSRPLSGTLDSIARSAGCRDWALARAMSSPPARPASRGAPRDLDIMLEDLPDLRDVRITALAPEAFPAFALPDVIRTYREAIATLRELGARVEEASFPLDFDDMMVQNGRIIAAEAYALHRAYIEDPSLESIVAKRVSAASHRRRRFPTAITPRPSSRSLPHGCVDLDAS